MYSVSRHTNALEVDPVSKSEDKEFARLVDWVEGRVSEREARILEEQVASDATMQDNVTWLRAFALISEATVIASPPPKVRDILVDRFEEYAADKRRSGWLKRVVAALSFDSDLQPALGLRATGASESQRQLVYSSEVADVTINLRTRPHDGLADLYGQIFPVDGTDPGAFGAQLLNGASEAATTAANELGEFSFGALPPGTYEVLACSEQAEIRLTGVEVRRRT
ncbi:MAG: hypothetical protein AVDCRST_MAG01-01-880 [uncultured Rubrobacteraceae bacterium]|uniref:Carboxypeptidase regulatory-like domain-containing protein n=1 Tax=uncultured Rubrobacteraceae bacterium TaxID=349277 RepID=A0A6J4NU58_9ACTN|nr:MAG: hypothetical protein AVDCRST_MAG01-01-880 [uncultured Rubrobacteraceae bacterium]